FGLTLSETEPPAIIVNDHADVIRIVEGCCAPIKCSVVEGPFWRRDLPNQLRKLAPIFVVAGLATRRCEVILVPPFEFSARWQRHPRGFLASDQIAADRHRGLASFWPKRGNDVDRPRTPIESG